MPLNDREPQFLQVYFIGNDEDELQNRSNIYKNMDQEIIENLQKFYHKNNKLIKLFKYALELMPKDTCKIIFKADKVPAKDHKKRYNAPDKNDIAIVMVDNGSVSRDIILHKRNSEIQRVRETHGCYDALQYPILFWNGDYGYHFNLTHNNSTKKVNRNFTIYI